MLLLSFSWKEVVLLGKISFGYRVVSRLKDLECICLLLLKSEFEEVLLIGVCDVFG